MRFSLRLNNDLPLADYITLARAAEEAGFDQFWISNDLFLRSALAILPALAVATAHIELGTGIVNPYTLNPGEIAMFAATMDELSGSRFNLGLAAGAGEFLKWVGIEQGATLGALRETIDAIRRLQAGERAAIDGSFLHWRSEAYLRFAAPRCTPIYIGAMGPKMLALSGELADGALPLLFPPSTILAYCRICRKERHGAKEDSASWTSQPASGFHSPTIALLPAACWRRRSPIMATRLAR